MKSISIIIPCLLYSFSAMCQLNHEVMLQIVPTGSVKITEAQLRTSTHAGFDDKMAADFHNHIYKKDNLLIYYINLGLTSPKFKKSLESNLKTTVSLLLGDSELKSTINVVDTSKIITINNIRFLIIKYHENDTNYIRFTSDYDKNLEYINGFIEYSKVDRLEAQQYLYDYLRSFHFINN